MADYKRLVSYIYNYEAGIRNRNIGFSRVESKNGQCKVTIHITASISSVEPLKVYLFHRNGFKMEGILLGTMAVKNGTGDFRTETKANALMDTEYSLNDISGVLIILNQNKFFGSQWDDQEIHIENFYEYTKKAEQEPVAQLVKDIELKPQDVTEMLMEEDLAEQVRKPLITEEVQAAELEKSNKVSEAIETVASVVQSIFQEEKQEEPVVFQEEQDINASEVSEENNTEKSEESSVPESKEVYMESASVTEESVEEEKSEKVESAELKFEEEKSEEEIEEISLKEEETNSLKDEQIEAKEQVQVEATTLQETCCCSENYPECVRRILKSFPPVKPFPESEAKNWVRIEPKDIGMLPVETWVLANNSFLLHGYYNYRHLIFGILKLDKGEQYVIGVPGVLQSTEQTMAGMFGFHRFLSANEGENQYGTFGYWVQQVVL